MVEAGRRKRISNFEDCERLRHADTPNAQCSMPNNAAYVSKLERRVDQDDWSRCARVSHSPTVLVQLCQLMPKSVPLGLFVAISISLSRRIRQDRQELVPFHPFPGMLGAAWLSFLPVPCSSWLLARIVDPPPLLTHTPPHFLQAEPQNVEPQPLAKFPNYHCRDSSIFEKRQCSISFLCAVQLAEIRSINSLTSLTRLQKSKYSYTQQTTTGDQRSARCIDIRARWKRSKADWNHTTLGRSSHFLLGIFNWPLPPMHM